MKILFWISIFGIIYTFFGYPLSLILIKSILKKKRIQLNETKDFLVTYIVAAYNEEKSIERKLNNILELDYPMDKLQIIVASDSSTDKTNEIVKKIIKKNVNREIILYEVKERKGKTNAQNEAMDLASGEVIVFSDANSIWRKDSLRKLIRNFSDKSIEYVTGQLKYINSFDNITSNVENSYWNYDLWMRKIESDYASITAGNGAIYAIRKKNIIKIPVISCHDGLYPTIAVLNKRRAIYDEEAVAYEKAGENTRDEFKRKVRMNRGIIKNKYKNFQKYNPLKVGLYSYFYFCHRYLRYTLYAFHIALFISSFILSSVFFYRIFFIGQSIFYIFALLGKFIKIKLFYFPYYYTITIIAQIIGVIKEILGLEKPFWKKAESTR